MTAEPGVKQGDEDQHDSGQQSKSTASNQLTADRQLG
jgi:hypothetical protein